MLFFVVSIYDSKNPLSLRVYIVYILYLVVVIQDKDGVTTMIVCWDTNQE